MNVFRWGLWHVTDLNKTVLSNSHCVYELATFSKHNKQVIHLFLGEMDFS